jgi:hypothetical protein
MTSSPAKNFSKIPCTRTLPNVLNTKPKSLKSSDWRMEPSLVRGYRVGCGIGTRSYKKGCKVRLLR